MNNYSIEQIEKLRTHIIKIINNSEFGKYKNSCSGIADCQNITNYKYRHIKEYLYYCSECINLKRTEIPMLKLNCFYIGK